MYVIPESVTASLPVSGKTDSTHPLIHSASAPGALMATEGVNVHIAGQVSKPSYRAMSADSAVHPIGSPHSISVT